MLFLWYVRLSKDLAVICSKSYCLFSGLNDENLWCFDAFTPYSSRKVREISIYLISGQVSTFYVCWLFWCKCYILLLNTISAPWILIFQQIYFQILFWFREHKHWFTWVHCKYSPCVFAQVCWRCAWDLRSYGCSLWLYNV